MEFLEEKVQEFREKFENTDFSGDIGEFVWILKDTHGYDYELEDFLSSLRSALHSAYRKGREDQKKDDDLFIKKVKKEDVHYDWKKSP